MAEERGRIALVRQALRNRLLRRVLAAYLLFNVAELASWLALLVWAYQSWGVGGASGVALAQLVPAALLAAPAASWLGGFSRVGVLRIGYAAQAVGHTVPGILVVVGASPWLVVLAAAGAGLTVALTRPAHHAILPEISRTTADLTTANAASGGLESVAAFMGPALAAVVLAWRGPGETLVACGVLMALATALSPHAGAGASAASDRSLGLAASGSALGAVLRSPEARVLSALSLAEFTLLGLSDILLVVLALDVLHLDSGGPGLLTAALGVGGVVGSGFTFLLVGRRRLAVPVLVGAVGAGVCFALAGSAAVAATAMVAVAACGAFLVHLDIAARTLTQRLLPDRLLAAMFGVREAVMMTGLALGSLAAPLLVTLAGPRATFVAAGAFLPVVVVALIRSIARLDRRTAVPEDVFSLLAGVPTLRLLPPRMLERLAIDAVPVAAPAGRVVVAEGEDGDLFYVVESGALEVSVAGEPVRVLGPGHGFGELALLRRTPRTATVTARSDCRLWSVDRDGFLGAVGRSPEALDAAETHIRDTYRT
jgi:MFS family permease